MPRDSCSGHSNYLHPVMSLSNFKSLIPLVSSLIIEISSWNFSYLFCFFQFQFIYLFPFSQFGFTHEDIVFTQEYFLDYSLLCVRYLNFSFFDELTVFQSHLKHFLVECRIHHLFSMKVVFTLITFLSTCFHF